MMRSKRKRVLAEATARHGVRRITAFAFTPKVPPNEFQLWNVGDNPTDYGVHKWTARSVTEVMGEYEKRGNLLLVDVEHNAAVAAELEAGGDLMQTPPVTGGYAALEIRGGAPWLTFDWSAYAVEQIASGERRFLSPEYEVDESTGEITRIIRVSLVASPGTHRARILATAASDNERDKNKMDTDSIIAALKGAMSLDPEAQAAFLKSFVAQLEGTGDTVDPVDENGNVMDAPVVADAAPVADDKKVAASSDDDAKKEPVKTAALVVAPAVKAASDVAAPLKAALVDLENGQRDFLIATQGERLDPSIRVWASSQPLAIVKGLIGAAPAKQVATVRASATRGDTQGAPVQPKGLEGADLEQMQKAFGTYRANASERPYKNEKGSFVVPTITPTRARQLKAESAAKGSK